MGFIQAVRDLGTLDAGTGIEPYLKFPLNRGGRLIRAYLNITDIQAARLDIHGITRVDVIEQADSQDMKNKYLYRDRTGANSSWGFTPLHRLGRPRNHDTVRRGWIGSDNNWRRDSKSHLYKIRNRLLMDYEIEGFFSSGSAERIVSDLELKLAEIIDLQQVGYSYAIIFGGDAGDNFVYPGEIDACKRYFQYKLTSSLRREESKPEQPCSLCGLMTTDYATLSHVFKFATTDKVNFLPGLDRERENHAFSICQQCLEKVSAGRERIERSLSNGLLVPGVQLWIIPEAVGEKDLHSVEQAAKWLERTQHKIAGKPDGEPTSVLFGSMPLDARDVLLHFVFWEKNNAQELVHLMVEDISLDRLAFLEQAWQQSLKTVMGKEYPFADLGWAMRSLHEVLGRMAGNNEPNRLVFRDFGIKLIGTMLAGGILPVKMFKRIVATRSAGMVQNYANWMETRKALLYANAWVEFMQRLNRR